MNRILLFVLIGLSGQVGAAPVIEFLWEPPDGGGDVRSEAMVIVTEEANDARMCWKSMDLEPGTHEADWTVRDASDRIVASKTHRIEDEARPVVACDRVPDPPEDAVFGEWQFEVVVDGQDRAERSIEVVQSFEDWSQYDLGYIPYVRGRTNYRPENRDRYSGNVIIELAVNAEGAVADVNLVESEGATDYAERLVLEAGRHYRFPPDPARTEEPLRIRQGMKLEP